MKPKEAIDTLKALCAAVEWDFPLDYAAAIDEAIEALEKQVPKKPIDGYMFDESFRSILTKMHPEMANKTGSCCPCCGKHIGNGEATLRKKNYMPFCHWCGQKLEQPEDE